MYSRLAIFIILLTNFLLTETIVVKSKPKSRLPGLGNNTDASQQLFKMAWLVTRLRRLALLLGVRIHAAS